MNETKLFTPDEFEASMVDEFDAIAFGCPAMGDEVLEESEFEPMFSVCEALLTKKMENIVGIYLTVPVNSAILKYG